MLRSVILLINLVSWPVLANMDLLSPVKTDSPQDTVRTFMESMDRYREAVRNGDDEVLNSVLERAVRTLDLSEVPVVIREDTGREAAVFLKEVIDRVIKIDYDYIPPGVKDPEVRSPWRLRYTEIRVVKVKKGPREGEYLFSSDTVARVKGFYNIVKARPYVEGSGGGAGYRPPWLQDRVPEWLRGSLFGIQNWQYIGAFIAILLGLVFRRMVFLVMQLGAKFTSRSKSDLDDRLLAVIRRPFSWVAASAFWFLCMRFLQFEGAVLSVLGTIIQVIFSFSVVWVFYRLSSVLTEYVDVVFRKADVGLDEQLVPIINKAVRIFVIVFGSLIAFQNLGINVMSLVAGLGLGGLAFALAAKDAAANLFGSVMIFSDSPFRVGDWIKFGEMEGTVESVGFRSTKIRTFYSSLITVPNAVVANASIDNLGRRHYRRIYTKIGVTYDTPAEKIEAFLEGIKNILLANSFTRKDYFHVVFSGYQDSSLEIMLYFFLKVPDWTEEILQRQNIYLEIKRLSEELGVAFAFPSSSLYVEQLPGSEKLSESCSKDELVEIAKKYQKGGESSKPEGLGIFKPLGSQP